MEAIQEIEILLVEDNPHDAELTMRALRKRKVANRITWLQDGQAALDYIFQRGEYRDRKPGQPALVLLDLKMPKIDGIEVLREIKKNERTRRIPVVVMTSSEEDRDVAASYDLGVNSYVVKPVDFDALADVAGRAGYYWLAINRAPRQ